MIGVSQAGSLCADEISQWNKIFGNPVIATAILERILHHSSTINIKGNSYGLREEVKVGHIRKPEVKENPQEWGYYWTSVDKMNYSIEKGALAVSRTPGSGPSTRMIRE